MTKKFAIALTALGVALSVFGWMAADINTAFLASYMLFAATILWLAVLVGWLRKP
jgi:hypothetical protein